MVPENTSISKADALAEAYKRGLLPPDKKAAYEEAMKRGLVQPVVTPPKPAPMSQPDATPWGDGQAFDDMYARKPQTDPMNLPLMPGARTLTSGQPTRMKPPPAPRGPVMSPAQRQATQPGRDAAVAKRTEQANRWKTDSPFGTPVDEMGMPIAVTDAQRDGGMYGVRDDVGKGIVASPIHAERAVVGATESILNLPADVYNEVQRANARHVLTPQEEMRNVNRMPQLMGQVGVQKAPPVQVPRFDFSAAKIPVPQELESVSGALGEGLAQFLISRKLVGKVAPGGGLAANTGKDAAAVFVGIDGSTGRMADVIDPNAIPEGPLRDYFNFLKTQPDDSPLLGRFKNFLEDMTVSGPMIVPQTVIAPAARAVGSAINPTLTPTNAGGVAASAGVPRPQPAPGSAVPDPRIGAPPRGSDLPPDQRPSGSRPIPGAWAVADDGAMLPNAQAPTPPYPRPDATQPAAPQQPAAPAAPTVAQTAPQAPTQPQTATAPPVPPTPPNAPAVTAGAAQPVPARSRAEQRADDLLIKKLAADGITMDDVRKIQARLARRGDSGVYETIGEIAALTDKSSGANLRGLQMAGGAAPGPLQEALVGLVNQNTEKLSPRLSRGATRATGQKADNAVATLDELETRLRTEATPAYDDAYATPVNPQVFANEILPVLNTPSGQKALQAARNNLASIAADLQGRAARGASERATMESQRAQAAVKSIDDFMADPVRGTAIPTTMAMDYTKRAFDDVIADAGFGSDTARIVGGTKRNFADSVSQATGGQYGNALGVFEDVKRLEDAFEVGTQALNKKTWELERELAKGRGGSPWTAGEVEALAMGVARNIEDLIEANNQSALTKLLKDKALKNMATALGSQKAADMFEETIRRLGANREWGRRVAGGSDTAMRQAAIRDAGMEGEDAITRVLDRVETSGNQFSLPGLVNDVAVKPIARTAKDIYQRLRYPGVYDEEVNRALIPLIGKPMTEGNLNEVIRRVEARMAEKGLIPPAQPAAVAAPPPAPRSRPRGPRGNPPGTTSSASATGTGIVAGGVLGAMAPADDENEQFINALFTAAGVGTAAGVAAKLAKGGKPPPASGKGAKPKAPPAPGFDQRFMKEAQRLVSYNGGVDKALKAQQYVIDQLKNSKAPNAQDRLNRAVSVQYAIRRMADRSNRELDEIAATAPRSGPPGVKPPPVKMGFGGSQLPAGYKKSLAVVHNLSEANLLHADEIGGLAAPSLAVIDSDKGAMSGFGEVSLLADPNILKSGGIRTFDSDVYSPRHPRAEYKITDKKMLDFRDFINKETEGLGDLRGVDWDSVSREGPSALARNDQVRAAFLKSRGELPARLPRKKMPDDLGADHVEAAKLPAAAGDRWEFRKNPDLVRIANRHYETEMVKLREIDPSMAKSVEDRIFDVAEDGTKSVSFTYIDRFAQDARRAKEALDGGVDATALSSIISRKLQNKKTADALDEYVSQISSNLFGERRLYKGMTESGNRRYSPYTMENILREMTKTIRGGENWHYGAGSIRAKYARELKSLDEIRKNKDKLVASGGMEDAKKAIQDKLSDLIFTHLEPYYRFKGGNRFSAMNEMSKAIADGPRALREVFDFKGNPEPMQRIQEFIDELKSMPTEYFEAKANRAVGLNEFAVAIVPRGASPKTIDALKRAGLKIKYYTKGDEASRAKAIQSEKQYLAGISGGAQGIADNLKQDAGIALLGSAGGSFANQDDPQAGALAGMGLALGGKYGPRAVNAMRGAGRVKPPPVQNGFSSGKAESRPKPPPKGQKAPPKGPPGTLSRMVAGGAVGGLAGSLGGDANAQEDLTGKISQTEQTIAELKKAMADLDKITDPFEKQRFLKAQGYYAGKIDGDIAGKTTEGMERWKAKKEAELEKAEAERKDLVRRDALQSNRPDPLMMALREYGPAVLGIGALFGMKYMRGGAAKASIKTAEAASNKLNKLITKGPVTGAMNKRDENRFANLNKLWQKGGASKEELPFKQDGAGKYKPNAKAKLPEELFADSGVWQTVTKYVKGKDVAIILGGGLDVAIAQPFIDKANENLSKAEAAWNDTPSDETAKALEDAKNEVAAYTLLQRIGMGVAAGRILGTFGGAYAKPMPNIPAAASEQAKLKQFIVSQKPPPKPRAKATPPAPKPRPKPRPKPPAPPAVPPTSQLPLPLKGGGKKKP